MPTNLYRSLMELHFDDKLQFVDGGADRNHGPVQFRRTSLTGFPAQSIRSSNAIALDSPYLLVLITGTSQSRQHESRKSPTKSLFDVGSRRISIINVNTKEYHSDVLAITTRIMHSISAHLLFGNRRLERTDLQAELARTKEKLENCIIKKKNEYAVLWNNWYTKCEECKYDKISYDKAYNDMKQKIEQLQAQLGDLKGKSSDTKCSSNTLVLVSQKLKDENVSLESQVRSYAKENEHLKTTYKNLFDSIKVTQAQTNSIIDSLQKQLYDTIYENAKLRAQLFVKVSEPKGTTKGTRMNTMFTKQSILGKPLSSSYKPKLYPVTPFPKSSILSKVDKTNALSKAVTSNSAPSTRESKVLQTVNVICHTPPRQKREA
ncbi:hypothetical protein Tco_1467631 [Tanacetum coccineum]